MAQFLLELLSEEIPARLQRRACEDLKRLVCEKLEAAKLSYASAEAYASPRRLALRVEGLPLRQADREIEIKGPRVGAPETVIQGFLKSRGIGSLSECEQRQSGRGQFWFFIERAKGRTTSQVLAEFLPGVVTNFPWPKSMRWAYDRVIWVRPMHNVVAVLDGELVPFVIDFGSPEHPHPIASCKETEGHRFLAPQPFRVSTFDAYKEQLLGQKVLVDPAERRQKIREQVEQLTQAQSMRLRSDEDLLEEVVGLVEWPVVHLGRIDPTFMDLPPEVLTTAMRTHQKYFALEDSAGSIAPRFVLVSNIETTDGGAAIVAGNERVLRARLADAQFFWTQDQKITLEARLPALASVVFHARLGSVADKVNRIEALAAAIARRLPGSPVVAARRAARLCKTDLGTGMVGEFPELQGIMGRYYASLEGETPDVANAIAEHYAPLGPSDRCPSAPVSVAISLADKIDTLVGFWGIGEKPTGSKDPFALRRAALGAIRLLIENGLRFGLLEAFEVALEAYEAQGLRFDRQSVRRDLLDFFAERLKVALREKGVRHDLIAAVFALTQAGGLGEDDFVRLLNRVDALADFLRGDDGANLLNASKRAGNILRIEEKKDGRPYDEPPEPSLLRAPEEIGLAQAMTQAQRRAEAALRDESFGAAMVALAGLRRPVDDFFDKVTVNSNDPAERANRLRLLARIRATLSTVADFSKIEG